MTAVKTSVWREIGKIKTKKCIFLSLITLDFPLSAISQNYLFENGVLSCTHAAKSLLTPSQKSASSVSLRVPFSMNYIITCQPLPVVCQWLCCTTDILRNISRGKHGACIMAVAHIYTYCMCRYETPSPQASPILPPCFLDPQLSRRRNNLDCCGTY